MWCIQSVKNQVFTDNIIYTYFPTEFLAFSGGNKTLSNPIFFFTLRHIAWKSKSNSKLRAKRATFTFWVNKSSIKKYQKWSVLASFWKTWSLRSNSVTRQVSFNCAKIGGKCQNSKIQMRHFRWFSITVNEVNDIYPVFFPRDFEKFDVISKAPILDFHYWASNNEKNPRVCSIPSFRANLHN